jgi:type I restriction enzyme S subunit
MVRDGYKNTEVGVIPLDWEVKHLPDVVDFIHGKAHEKHITKSGKYTVVNSKFVSTDGRVTKQSSDNFQPARKGDVLTVLSDLPNGKALAKCYLVEEDDKYAVNQRVCIYRSKSADSGYLKYILNRNPYFLKFDDGVTQTHILNHHIKECQFPLPPTRTEQTAIATALSDADALLSALDGLVAKKEAFKRGMMEGLFTDKLNWKPTTLADNCEVITKGTTPTSYGHKYQKSGVTFVKIESLCNDFLIDRNKTAYINFETHQVQKRSQLQAGDILISIAGALGKIGVVYKKDLPANTNQALAIVRLSESSVIDQEYLKYYLTSKSVVRQFQEAGSQGAQPNLSLANIGDLVIKHPGNRRQVEIATLLSDLDAELSALRARRAKLGLVKGGMMEVLLSGGVRLV